METDAQNLELIQRLMLEAGRIMEDTAPELALNLPEDRDGAGKRVARLARSASVLWALATAATALLQF